ncbi:hypothetical protein GF361_03865 [Candidatus Woesearchaeota archaeon]|nr:hypothetical protein [Candidatus Woesearchaeota archaeon]
MNKRGQRKVLWTVIEITFAGMLILLSAYILATFTAVFLGPSSQQQAANNNFDFLANQTQKLLEKPEFFASDTIQFNIPDGYILVGFDQDWQGDTVEANACRKESIKKPQRCSDKACLCLYEDTVADDFEDDSNKDKLIKCTRLEKNNQGIFISGPADNYHNLNNCEKESNTIDYDNDCPNDGAQKLPPPPAVYLNLPGASSFKYEFLVIYGDCDDEWGIRQLYIEKFRNEANNNKTYIFISEKSDQIKEREKELKEKASEQILEDICVLPLENNNCNGAFHINICKKQEPNTDYQKCNQALSGCKRILADFSRTPAAIEAKNYLENITICYRFKSSYYLSQNNQQKADELFQYEIDLYKSLINLINISVENYEYLLRIGDVYSNKNFTGHDYAAAVNHYKKIIDDPKLNNVLAKQKIGNICRISPQPVICQGLDAKYLP